MTTTAYSDVINRAFAFAAKHHDRQVRKGTKLPYLTHPANVAVILSRYGCDSDTVVAGILHDVIEDCIRDGYTREMLEQRVGDKFGAKVLETVLAVTYRRQDDEGIELSGDERKSDYLERLSNASEEARWVCAADKIHNAATIISDLRRTVDREAVWSRFGGGGTATARWHRQVYEWVRAAGGYVPDSAELDAVFVQTTW